MGVLRPIVEADVPIFYLQHRDPEAQRMAAFVARDEEAFAAHWASILADERITKRTIVSDGEVAGNVVAFDAEGRRLVGYWLGREFWGRGLATQALAELLREEPERPLHAVVAQSNVASIRVLEKCGFVPVETRTEVDEALGEIEEVVLELQ